MKILVTGANGMLGSDLCPMLEDAGFDVVETDIDNLDITNEIQVRNTIKSEQPDYVIHCAAYTNVDEAESKPDLANKINCNGTEIIAKACTNENATLIYISTDYVFDGSKTEPYETTDEPKPINEYGQSKFNGEILVKKHCKKYYITRTGWLYGHHGKNFVETMIGNANKKELKVVNDQYGCPTWTIDLSEAIIDLIDDEPEYGIYHLCGGGETTWYEFAKEIFRLTNIKTNLKPCKSEEYPRPAKRPMYSVMNNNGLLRDWKLALKDYIELRIE